MSSVPGAPYDPYQPPKAVEPKPSAAAPGAGGIRYMYAYSYVFENPNWMTNILYGFLCMIIPVVGPLLLLGYQFEIAEFQHRFPGRVYPDFNFNKFAYYLVRGLWPFLVQMVCMVPLMIIIYVLVFAGIMILGLVAQAAGREAGGIVMGLGMFLFFFMEIVLIVLINVVMQPLMLRAGLAQDFGQAFKFGWAIDFIKRMWLSMVLFQLFFMVTALPLILGGALLFCIGAYAAAALIVLAQANMYLQLYNLYLARGGEPVPLKDPPPEIAQSWAI